ncbi:hypothetical protein RB977_004061 [Vibrio harveyi]|nr:hypothetical protein [Vibrio harveyi]
MKCVYCCNEIEEGEFAREHVPPKSFFKKGTSNLITIPACRECNNKKSSDDELVRNIFAMSDLIAINPDHQFFMDKTLKAIKRPQKAQFVESVIASSHEVLTEDGTKTAFEFDAQKVMDWVGKNALGLLVYHGYIDCCDKSHLTFQLNLLDVNKNMERAILNTSMALMTTEPCIRIGDTEFGYWIKEYDQGFILIQCFYEQLSFVTKTER